MTAAAAPAIEIDRGTARALLADAAKLANGNAAAGLALLLSRILADEYHADLEAGRAHAQALATEALALGDDPDPTQTGREVAATAVVHARELLEESAAMLDAEAAAGREDDAAEWLPPLPLVAATEALPYPEDALPPRIRDAVEEVRAFVQAPLPLVAASALSAVSVAIQAHVDIERAPTLRGPVGVSMLTIGDSGERKTTLDNYFAAPIAEYEAAEAAAMAPVIADHRANLEAWQAKRNGILDRIRSDRKADRSTVAHEEALRDLERGKPMPPRVPKLLRGDDTPENLAWELATRWPSAGLLSSEAGLIFGAHGMGRDSIMRNLALLNVLWDGRPHEIGRRRSDSFVLRSARFTLGLMVQEPTLRSFFSEGGALARGIGFFARFLIAWPASTQGQRRYCEPPTDWPRLGAFRRRLRQILDTPAPFDADGRLTPQPLPLRADAKRLWIAFHDTIEGQLGAGGELFDVRDVASKSAENAARLAALLHYFEHGETAIGADAFERASRIAAWHIAEARRFFGELAMPVEVSDALRLDAWLVDYCVREDSAAVPVNIVQKLGPAGLRAKAAIETTVRELAELHRARLAKDGRARLILVNPALLPARTAGTARTATARGEQQ